MVGATSDPSTRDGKPGHGCGSPGSGLGLSLVRAVARLHDGDVRLGDASPGLVVTLDLPRG